MAQGLTKSQVTDHLAEKVGTTPKMVRQFFGSPGRAGLQGGEQCLHAVGHWKAAGGPSPGPQGTQYEDGEPDSARH